LLHNRHHLICGIVSDNPEIERWTALHRLALLKPGADLRGNPVTRSFDYLFSLSSELDTPQDALWAAQSGAIACHNGPLDGFSGPHAPAWAVLRGETEHCVTWYEPAAADNSVLKQRSFTIAAHETTASLTLRCAEAAVESLGELIDELANDTVTRVEQARPVASQRLLRPEAAGTIDPTADATQITALVRGLDFGQLPNTLGRAKLWLGSSAAAVGQVAQPDRAPQAGAVPGSLLAIEDDALIVESGSGPIALRGLSRLEGGPLSPRDLVASARLVVGDALPQLDAETARRLGALDASLSPQESFWTERLRKLESIALPASDSSLLPTQQPVYVAADCELPSLTSSGPNGADVAAGVCAAYLARVTDQNEFSVAFCDPSLRRMIAGFESLFSAQVPLRVQLEPSHGLRPALERFRAELAIVRRRGSFARDAISRDPVLRGRSDLAGGAICTVGISQVGRIEDADPLPGTELTIAVSADGTRCRWIHDVSRGGENAMETLLEQFENFVTCIYDNGLRPLREIALLHPDERDKVLVDWNAKRVNVASECCVHQSFVDQAQRTPEARALGHRGESLSFAELDASSDHLAARLRRVGIGPGRLVAVYVHRSTELINSALAIWKAGGAFVPIDPELSAENTAFVLDDASPHALVSWRELADGLAAAPPLVELDESPLRQTQTDSEVETTAEPVESKRLACVSYSRHGAYGPNGALLDHQSIANFLAGMDAHVGNRRAGVWLAAESPELVRFVLEAFWGLTRGFEVILCDDPRSTEAPRRSGPHAHRELSFSLATATSAGEDPQPKSYARLIELARFADQHSFDAVWSPGSPAEPEAVVTIAAIAAVTSEVRIRSHGAATDSPGSRAAQRPALDSLAQGRLEDRPAVRTTELPHYESAGLAGSSVRADSDIDEIAGNIEAYRRAWDSSGHPGTGHVTVETPLPVGEQMHIALDRIDLLAGAGVDEIAWQLDAGAEPEAWQSQLDLARELRLSAHPACSDGAGRVLSVAALAAAHGATHLQCTSVVLERLLAAEDGRAALAALELLLVMNPPLSREMLAELQAVGVKNVLELLAPVGTAIAVSANRPYESGPPNNGRPVGRPLANQEIYILDAHRQPVAIGVPGELLIGGSDANYAFLRHPAHMRERLAAHPFRKHNGERVYRTLRLARYRDNGAVELLGHLERQIIIRGHRVDLDDVAQIITQHYEVSEARVISYETEPNATLLMAAVVSTSRRSLDEAELKKFCEERLADYLVPAKFWFLDHLPKS
jgi:non-ribosomal peptide synthetase component F/methionyl-tRNA formyltransferase